MRRILCLLAISLPLIFLGSTASAPQLQAEDYPTTLDLPNGWLPESIVIGRNNEIYSGSRRNGAIYAVNIETGEGRIIYGGRDGRIAVGIDLDNRSNYIFAAGGATGEAHVYDAATGESKASFRLSTGTGTFVNDVIVTQDGAYFTDSMRPVFYRIPLDAEGGLPAQSEVQTISYFGDYVHAAGGNANGIEATPTGDRLIIVQSSTGRLFQLHPITGRTSAIDLGGETVTNGDGILRDGEWLYVVRNQNNVVVKIKLDPSFSRGEVVDRLTHPGFETPTGITHSGSRLYVVNARFAAGNAPTVSYGIYALDKGPLSE